MSLHYFAYGSNMLRERLTERVGPVAVRSVGVLVQHRLAFHKRSKDGSAKCNALHTGNDSDQMYGVVYRMGEQQKRLLDHHERNGYKPSEVLIELDEDCVLRAYTYLAEDSYIETELSPYAWYHALVLAGAQQHRLPAQYIQSINSVTPVSDPDNSRHQRHMAILSLR